MKVVQSIQDILTAVTQEITVILVFFISLALWKHIGQRNKVVKQRKTLSPHSSPSQPTVAPKQVQAEHCPEVIDGKRLQAIQNAETQMLQLLEQREFTRALNFFR